MSEISNPVRNPVVVRTHGGLGNQLFQILYARLLAGGAELSVVHDANYPHAFGLSPAFADIPAPGPIASVISRLRIPKILERLGLDTRGAIRLAGTHYADGYFQEVGLYRPFASELQQQIDDLRRCLGISNTPPVGDALFHIRLGDFFDTEAKQREHLRMRLIQLPAGAFIMSNRDDLLMEEIAAPDLVALDLSIVATQGASAEETIRRMGDYRTIYSNDSTLAFWAACLTGRELVTPSPKLNALFRLFSNREATSATQ